MAEKTAPAMEKNEAPKDATAPVDAASEAPKEIDTKEVSQTIRLLRFKLSTLAGDARRKNPFMSRSQEEAKAKYRAAIKSVSELANFIDSQATT